MHWYITSIHNSAFPCSTWLYPQELLLVQLMVLLQIMMMIVDCWLLLMIAITTIQVYLLCLVWFTTITITARSTTLTTTKFLRLQLLLLLLIFTTTTTTTTISRWWRCPSLHRGEVRRGSAAESAGTVWTLCDDNSRWGCFRYLVQVQLNIQMMMILVMMMMMMMMLMMLMMISSIKYHIHHFHAHMKGNLYGYQMLMGDNSHSCIYLCSTLTSEAVVHTVTGSKGFIVCYCSSITPSHSR